MTLLAACAGGGEKKDTPDSAAAAATAAPPPAESFTLKAEDGSWSGDISPAGIVYRKGRDSLVFAYKAPNVQSAITDYEQLMMEGKDTVRISISLAMTKCTDKAGAEYTHIAQLWLTGKQGGRELNTQTKGCANKK